MRKTGALTLGLDVVALFVVALFTFGMTASLMSAHDWVELAVFGGLGTIGAYLTGRAILNLKARLSEST